MEYMEAVTTMAQYTMNEVIDDVKETDGYERKGEVSIGFFLCDVHSRYFAVNVHADTSTLKVDFINITGLSF